MTTTTARPSSNPVPTPAELLDIALASADRAADYLRALDRDHLAREYKTSSHDIVTEHDRKSEEIIVSELRRLLPTCRIVGEEGGERPAEGPPSAPTDPWSASTSTPSTAPAISRPGCRCSASPSASPSMTSWWPG